MGRMRVFSLQVLLLWTYLLNFNAVLLLAHSNLNKLDTSISQSSSPLSLSSPSSSSSPSFTPYKAESNSMSLLTSPTATMPTKANTTKANLVTNLDLKHLSEDAIVENFELVDANNFPQSSSRSVRQTNSKRNGRQFIFDPTNFIFFQNFGAEGTKCITSRGTSGYCVGFGSCTTQNFYQFGNRLDLLAQQQWSMPPLSYGTEICNFFDQYGRTVSGICCTNENPFNGLPIGPPFGVPGQVNPIPAPPPESNPPDDGDDTQALDNPIAPTTETNKPQDESADGNHNENNEGSGDNTDKNSDLDESSPDFVDENNIPYDPIKDDGDISPTQGVVTYDDIRYQWQNQFVGQYPGIQQWPPPIPTHPPSTGSWPPPIPTHPPNHHYPTHPGTVTRPTTTSRPATTTRRATVTTVKTTRRPTTTTTTRRPSYPGAYPGYPSFPGYPGYPTHPAQRPTTAPATTTRRPPSTGSGSGTSEHGLPSQCGIKNPVSPDQQRIVGGTNASPHEFPWIAVLFKSGKQFCGGSLITNNHILTAAHCVARMTQWDVAALTVHLGDYDIRRDYEVKHVARRVKRLVRHKGFDFTHLHNDVAVLTLSEPVKFTREIQPICLPTSTAQQGRSYSGQVATVAGWGSLRENGPQPSILQKVHIPIWSNIDCARKYGRAAPGGIIESMVCAGEASKDSCSGDSGGPMIVNEGGRYTQVGIVSWGIGCGKGQYPGVYTRVTALLPWIYKNIK